jgi:hypothetical protein
MSLISYDDEEPNPDLFDELLTKNNIGYMKYQKKSFQPSQITAEDSSSMSHGTRKSSRF